MAILGILPVNAAYFAYASGAADDPWFPTSDGIEAAAVVRVLFEYKFITLFSLLFGIGIGIQRLRADSAGRSFGSPMARRLLALAVFGFLHATLLWYGDIVFIYAWVGLALCWFAAARPTPLAWCGAGLLVVPLCVLALVGLISIAIPEAAIGFGEVEWTDGEGAAAATGEWGVFFETLLAEGDLDPDFESAVYAGPSYARAFLVRTVTWLWMLFAQSFYFMPRIGGLFLLGLAATRTDWALDPTSKRGRRLHMGLVAIALPLGLLMETSSAWLEIMSEQPHAWLVAEVVHYIGSLAMAGGIAAAIALVVTARPSALWTRPFAAIGRTAFSCYIGQSVAMTTLFYGHGVGLFGRLDRNELWTVVGAVWLSQLVLAPLWLAAFRMGPLEWIWRSITYWSPQPFRKGVGT